ncbi:MAG: VCBS repeat-containing protein, partial [Chloroflexi bacterium]|nr:VCBS repeat-containing protein [Chloroflexota bacterium]
LDLAVGDTPPVVYQYVGPNPTSDDAFSTAIQLPSGVVNGQRWSMRAVQVRTDGSIDLAITDRDGPTLMFNSFTPHLPPTLKPIDNFSASSVAWGDMNADGLQDLVLGAGNAPAVGSRIYYNVNGALSPANRQDLLPAGLGPQSVAIGDASGDTKLDIAIGTPNNAQVYLYASSTPTWTTGLPATPNHVVAWGDVNDDGRLDLAVGSSGAPVVVFLNRFGQLDATPTYTTPQVGDVRAIAWADFDRDGFMDFAVANYGGPARIYRNRHDGSFSLMWSSPASYNTTSIAAADYNGDSYPDLALGNYDQPSIIFENQSGTLTTTPVWSAPAPAKTTSIAFGDWNNDGFPELAVGNDGQPTQV